MTQLRRTLLLWALMFWLGGFTFYSAVVVPVGTDVLGSAANQGWVTRQVTGWLNFAGVVALAAWAWDVAADPAATILRQLVRWLLWLVIAAILVALFWLHVRMDDLLDPAVERILDRRGFRVLHRWYLWLSTVQWAASLVLLHSTLRAWARPR